MFLNDMQYLAYTSSILYFKPFIEIIVTTDVERRFLQSSLSSFLSST